MSEPIKRPVTLRAISERINRKLKKKNKKLVKNPPTMAATYGEYMVIDLNTNSVDGSYPMDIEALARELECLAEWEVIE